MNKTPAAEITESALHERILKAICTLETLYGPESVTRLLAGLVRYRQPQFVREMLQREENMKEATRVGPNGQGARKLGPTESTARPNGGPSGDTWHRLHRSAGPSTRAR